MLTGARYAGQPYGTERRTEQRAKKQKQADKTGAEQRSEQRDKKETQATSTAAAGGRGRGGRGRGFANSAGTLIYLLS